jgi:hypothetical protein
VAVVLVLGTVLVGVMGGGKAETSPVTTPTAISTEPPSVGAAPPVRSTLNTTPPPSGNAPRPRTRSQGTQTRCVPPGSPGRKRGAAARGCPRSQLRR